MSGISALPLPGSSATDLPFRANDNSGDPMILPDISFTLSQLRSYVADARAFLAELFATSSLTAERGLVSQSAPEWAARLIRKKGIAGAVIEKTGSLAFVRRRPDDASAFLAYVQKQERAEQPLLFRAGFGALKNLNHCGCHQEPDYAEYLTLVQLARLMQAVSGVYPFGVKVQIVPDNIRSCAANQCPEIYAFQYIGGLQRMARALGLENLIAVENGQERLYEVHNVPAYRAAAAEALSAWREGEPEAYADRWSTATENAGKNLSCATDRSAEEIEAAAWNYMVAYRAEVLSGLWTPGDAFPLRYARNPGHYQMYTLGFKKTKLPWQVSLPFSLLEERD